MTINPGEMHFRNQWLALKRVENMATHTHTPTCTLLRTHTNEATQSNSNISKARQRALILTRMLLYVPNNKNKFTRVGAANEVNNNQTITTTTIQQTVCQLDSQRLWPLVAANDKMLLPHHVLQAAYKHRYL